MPSRRKSLIASFLIFMINIVNVDAITCHRAEYRVGEECCPMCPPGNRVNKHCTEFTSTSCEPCSDGTFLDQLNGQIQCFPCIKCNAGSGLKVKRQCTTTSDAVCEPADGYRCIDHKADGCVAAQKHRSCKPGQYISQTGTATTDTVCSDCTGATYSDGTFTSCQPHTICESTGLQQIRPGNNSADTECGEKQNSSNTAGIVTGVVLSLIVTVAAIAAYIYLKKKGGKITGGIRAKLPAQETQRGEDASEAVVLRAPD